MSTCGWLARAVACFVLYLGCCVWLTWPLGAVLATGLPNTTSLIFDTLHTAWVLSWQAHSVTTAPLSLADANIYHPTPGALFYGQTAIGALPYFAPVYLATGNPALALNVMFLGGVALTATALHLVVYRWTRSHWSGVVAASAFLLTRWVLWEVVPTAPQYALLHIVPVIVLLAAYPTRRFPVVLLALIVFQALVDPVYLGAAMALPLGLVTAWRLIDRRTRPAGMRLAGALVLAGLALLVAFASHFAVRAENPHLAQQTLWTTPMAPFTFPWGLFGVGAPTAAPTPLLLLIPVGLAMVLLRRPPARLRRAWMHAGLWTASGVLMALGATALPFGDLFRVPARIGVAALLGVALLAGLAFAECARHLTRFHRLAPAALALLLSAAAYSEFTGGLRDPTFRRPPLPAYRVVRMSTLDAPVAAALADGGGALLEVPVGGGREAAWLNARAMYRSIFHWRPLLNGYDGYYPAAFPERMALAHRLPDPAALRALTATTGLSFIVVNVDDLPPERRAPWTRLAESGGSEDLHLLVRSRSQLLFAVDG